MYGNIAVKASIYSLILLQTMKDDPTKSANYEFYAGKIAFRPKGLIFICFNIPVTMLYDIVMYIVILMLMK